MGSYYSPLFHMLEDEQLAVYIPGRNILDRTARQPGKANIFPTFP
jgi:hypothetical protein